MTKSKAAKRRTPGRAGAAAARRAAERAGRRRQLMVRAGIGVGAVALVGGIAAGVALSQGSKPLPHADGTAAPPWPAPANPDAGVRLAGLHSLTAEGQALHFHTHLDIFVNGQRVTVPANIGINVSTHTLSELHTHDSTGIVHIEAPETTHRYVLGQLFDEWNVWLDKTHLDGLTNASGHTLAAFVNGKKFNGNPAQIELKKHGEIALMFGASAQQANPPSSYTFPSGV